jgi:hypothetical protein
MRPHLSACTAFQSCTLHKAFPICSALSGRSMGPHLSACTAFQRRTLYKAFRSCTAMCRSVEKLSRVVCAGHRHFELHISNPGHFSRRIRQLHPARLWECSSSRLGSVVWSWGGVLRDRLPGADHVVPVTGTLPTVWLHCNY